MSQNTQGIALLCGAAAFGLSTSVGGMSIATGITVATFAAGVVLLVLQNNKKSVENDSDAPKKKQGKKSTPSPQKASKAQQKTPKKPQHKEEPKEEPEEKESVEAPETPSNKKKKKAKKSGGATPLLSPSSPIAVKQKVAPKEEVKEEKEYTKTQLKKLKKREAEEKQKAAAEQQKAAELAKKAADQKREAAHQKKQQAKARKSVTKPPAQETKVETKAEVKQQQPAELEDGWEVPSSRKSRGPKDGKESKEPIVIDVKIPVRSHALIIGKQGDGLRKITQDLDVIITMPKRDSGNDLILIKGLPQNVRKAKKALEDTAKLGYSTITHPGYQTKFLPLADRFQLGLVFGKGGKNLQAISRESGAKLQMPEKDSGNLQIAISGEERDVDNAIAIIQELIEQGYSKATHPEWITEEIPVPPEAMGAIIGQKGANLKTLMDKYSTRIDVPRREDMTAKQDVITVKGQPKDIARLKGEIAQILASREPVLDQEVPDPQWQEDVQEIEW